MYRNPQRGVFPTPSLSNHTYLSIYIYLDGRNPPTHPFSFQFQITGNLAVYGFAFPLQLLHRRCLNSFLPDFLPGARSSFWLFFRVAEVVTLPQPQE